MANARARSVVGTTCLDPFERALLVRGRHGEGRMMSWSVEPTVTDRHDRGTLAAPLMARSRHAPGRSVLTAVCRGRGIDPLTVAVMCGMSPMHS
jgi:hypothetical protein